MRRTAARAPRHRLRPSAVGSMIRARRSSGSGRRDTSPSVSVWRDHAGMRGFVGRPAHVAIMRKYRVLGITRATTGRTEDVDPHGTWRTAARWLRDRA